MAYIHINGLHIDGLHIDGRHIDGRHIDGLNIDGLHFNGLHIDGHESLSDKITLTLTLCSFDNRKISTIPFSQN